MANERGQARLPNLRDLFTGSMAHVESLDQGSELNSAQLEVGKVGVPPAF